MGMTIIMTEYWDRWFIELVLRTLILSIGRIESNIILDLREIFYLLINIGDKFIMIGLSCHKSYRELILYLPTGDLELYSHNVLVLF
jgi:hypothetical protein